MDSLVFKKRSRETWTTECERCTGQQHKIKTKRKRFCMKCDRPSEGSLHDTVWCAVNTSRRTTTSKRQFMVCMVLIMDNIQLLPRTYSYYHNITATLCSFLVLC